MDLFVGTDALALLNKALDIILLRPERLPMCIDIQQIYK